MNDVTSNVSALAGSFAVVCLMTGKVVAQFQEEMNKIDPVSGASNSTSSVGGETIHAHHAIQVASALALSMGIFQVCIPRELSHGMPGSYWQSVL